MMCEQALCHCGGTNFVFPSTGLDVCAECSLSTASKLSKTEHLQFCVVVRIPCKQDHECQKNYQHRCEIAAYLTSSFWPGWYCNFHCRQLLLLLSLWIVIANKIHPRFLLVLMTKDIKVGLFLTHSLSFLMNLSRELLLVFLVLW